MFPISMRLRALAPVGDPVGRPDHVRLLREKDLPPRTAVLQRRTGFEPLPHPAAIGSSSRVRSEVSSLTTLFPGSYCGDAPSPDLIWQSFNLDPYLLACLALLAIALRRQPPALVAVAVLAVVFVSPLCAMAVALFSTRVVHHVLLVAVAAPLLAAALPAPRRAGLVPLHFMLSTAVLWVWHLPQAYDLALRDIGVYWIMQLSLLGSATLFWRAVLVGAEAISGVLWGLAGLIQMGLLGAILTLAPAPLYESHAQAPYLWGLTPLADQQLGGLLMWVPAMLPYLVVIAVLARRGWRSASVASA